MVKRKAQVDESWECLRVEKMGVLSPTTHPRGQWTHSTATPIYLALNPLTMTSTLLFHTGRCTALLYPTCPHIIPLAMAGCCWRVDESLHCRYQRTYTRGDLYACSSVERLQTTKTRFVRMCFLIITLKRHSLPKSKM